MRSKVLIVLALSALCIAHGCGDKDYHLVEVGNPEFKENRVFLSYEDLTSPKFPALKLKYQIDTVIKGEADEFKRILLLRNWIRAVIGNEDNKSHYSGEGYAEGILDAALQGEGFHCGHYMVVQNAVMNAYGYVTRCLGAGAGQKGNDIHHGVNEIWLNDYNKWFLSDAKYDHHFEKDGMPLSALEIREEYLKNKAVDVITVKGPLKTPVEYDEKMETHKERFPSTYTWISWDTYSDRYTAWPDFKTMLNMYQDDYFKNNTWIWGGKPHWAYHTEFLKLVDSRDAIEWTPNTIASDVIINGHAEIELRSNTPNFKEYQVKYMPEGKWQKTDKNLKIELSKKSHELIFRSVNLANVAGPQHKIIIRRN